MTVSPGRITDLDGLTVTPCAADDDVTRALSDAGAILAPMALESGIIDAIVTAPEIAVDLGLDPCFPSV